MFRGECDRTEWNIRGNGNEQRKYLQAAGGKRERERERMAEESDYQIFQVSTTA